MYCHLCKDTSEQTRVYISLRLVYFLFFFLFVCLGGGLFHVIHTGETTFRKNEKRYRHTMKIALYKVMFQQLCLSSPFGWLMDPLSRPASSPNQNVTINR